MTPMMMMIRSIAQVMSFTDAVFDLLESLSVGVAEKTSHIPTVVLVAATVSRSAMSWNVVVAVLDSLAKSVTAVPMFTSVIGVSACA